MNQSVDNYTLREALLVRGFEDITSENRKTKCWRFNHPRMQHWVSIKLGEDAQKPMAKAPLVIHPDDAAQVRAAISVDSGVAFEAKPYINSGTNYRGSHGQKVPGIAISLADVAAIESFVAAATGISSELPPLSGNQVERSQEADRGAGVAGNAVDPVLLAAAAAEVDAEDPQGNLSATTRQQLIEARLGQGKFRNEMLAIWEERCAVTDCGVAPALIASHAVAWRDDKRPEVRLDPYNGLLLTASIDRLFDQGLIAFADDGRLLYKPLLSQTDLRHLGLGADARLRRVHARHVPHLSAHRVKHGFDGA
ncbi:MAG: HNH endonuclease [Thiomonas arsenitoxydans]|uniref:HNH endonuclease n=1 Tax=Thiomonas arsenitoxydans (strain DSM 22701 / CIP 110005 / 3As) TaxID=426114 RepID=A0A8I1MYT4_THIA3|nr:HNH endonuclease [Thiomonas arsenitoxydans]